MDGKESLNICGHCRHFIVFSKRRRHDPSVQICKCKYQKCNFRHIDVHVTTKEIYRFEYAMNVRYIRHVTNTCTD